MRFHALFPLGLALSVFVPFVGGCGKSPSWYAAQVELQRFDIVRYDEKGNPASADVEFSWFECPGTQIEVIRGGAEFAACMAKHKIGEKVPVKVFYHPGDEGAWDWDVHEMAGCARPPDPGDEASFDTVQECEPLLVNGASVGIHCKRIPEKHLLAKCPWFARH